MQKIAEAKAINEANARAVRQNATRALIANTPSAAQGPGFSPQSSAYDRAQYGDRASGQPLVPAPHLNFTAPAKPYTVGGAPAGGPAPAEIKDFYANPQTGPNSPAAKATIAAANTGQTVQTPYGPVSSAPPAAQGPNLAGAPGAANWQQQIVNAHPQIGVAGSPENKAFVAAYKQQYPNGGQPTDHMKLAGDVMSDIADQKAKDASESGELAEGDESQRSTGIPASPPSAAFKAARAVVEAPGNAADAVANAARGVVGGIAKTGADIYAGLHPGVDPNIANTAAQNLVDQGAAAFGKAVDPITTVAPPINTAPGSYMAQNMATPQSPDALRAARQTQIAQNQPGAIAPYDRSASTLAGAPSSTAATNGQTYQVPTPPPVAAATVAPKDEEE